MPQAADRLTVMVLFVRDRWCRWEVAGCRAVAMAAMLQGTGNDWVSMMLTLTAGASGGATHPQSAHPQAGCKRRSGQAAGHCWQRPDSQ